jgi:SAM-dependent methyltransferase
VDDRFHAFQRDVEDWHWWYAVRREILDRKLARLALDPARTRLLDVGCGTGGASLVLSRYGRAVALDRAAESFRLAPDRPYAHRVISGADGPLPFGDGTFDVVCALDILEHLDDDRAALAELVRVMRPGGHLVVFVPAFSILWGYNDEFSQHRRRYTRRQLDELVRGAGLAVHDSGYFNMLLFLPTLAARLLQRALPSATRGMEHEPKRGPLNELLRRLFRCELPALAVGGLPLGTSAYTVAQKGDA